VSEHIIRGKDCLPRLFKTRREAREFAETEYGYIRTRPDLQREPHGWTVPKSIKVDVVEISSFTEANPLITNKKTTPRIDFRKEARKTRKIRLALQKRTTHQAP
jgi:hypothetical protein